MGNGGMSGRGQQGDFETRGGMVVGSRGEWRQEGSGRGNARG